jgi:hypothetical protein
MHVKLGINQPLPSKAIDIMMTKQVNASNTRAAIGNRQSKMWKAMIHKDINV